MCTDYDIWYACGHKCEPARVDAPNASEIYMECTATTPTARVIKRCKQFQKSGKVCPPHQRDVITDLFPIFCPKDDCNPPPEEFDDDGCILLWKNIEESTIAGRNWANSLTEKEKIEMYKASARISQPPVWGRKGPHVKKQRRVKTKVEREREKNEREVESRTSETLIIGPMEKPRRGGRKKPAADANKPTETTVAVEKSKGKKRKAEYEDYATAQKIAPAKKLKVEPKPKKPESEPEAKKPRAEPKLKKGKAGPETKKLQDFSQKIVLKNTTNILAKKEAEGAPHKGKKRKVPDDAGQAQKPAQKPKAVPTKQPKVAFVIPDDDEPESEQPKAKKAKTGATTARPKKGQAPASQELDIHIIN
ncbi:hypothetical protein ABW20_dc0101309 [Dactylellina cionopaga]|nr:hypothetical protein ABW20_dc0101309 [Dactylellina cionopaga]